MSIVKVKRATCKDIVPVCLLLTLAGISRKVGLSNVCGICSQFARFMFDFLSSAQFGTYVIDYSTSLSLIVDISCWLLIFTYIDVVIS